MIFKQFESSFLPDKTGFFLKMSHNLAHLVNKKHLTKYNATLKTEVAHLVR